MDTTAGRVGGRTIAVAEAVTLAGFVAFLAVPSAVRLVATGVMVGAGCAVVALAAVRLRRRAGRAGAAWVAVASVLGLLGSVVDLSVIEDEPTAIPIAGTFVLLVSLVGLVVSALLLRRR